MASLLLIDDDAALLELLADYLREAGHVVHTAVNGDEGLKTFFSTQPELVILDVTMPQRDGWQLLERIREMASTPVIMLTARNEEVNILRGFKLGADDYVTKPFSFAEMAARVQSVLSRTYGLIRQGKSDENVHLLRQGDLVIDLTAKKVWRGKELISLTPTELKLLQVLMQHPGEVLSSQLLVREVWGEQYVSDVGYVRRYIWHLRQKVEIDPDQPRYIHNEHGFGYRFYALTEEERS
ncbi:MAG: DNA-binding response regulator [Chloroflexota bacterium]|nr:response regulator transcription factor [Ardenticatenaceae bacterium]GIK55160.1 MAG: DNA-binding response regulator [Chloroflexota bacterium]